MVDIDFIKKFVVMDDSLPLIDEGDTIPLELVQFMQDKPISRLEALVRKKRAIDKGPQYVKIEFLCEQCGQLYVDTVERTRIRWLKKSNINRICQDCAEKRRLQKIQEDKMLHQQAEVYRKMKEEEMRKRREEHEAKYNDVISTYLVPSDNLSAPTPKMYLEMKEKIEDLSAEFIEDFADEVCGMFGKHTLSSTTYWSILAAEKQRTTIKPACAISGSTKDLQLVQASRIAVGYEYATLNNLMFVNGALLTERSIDEIWAMKMSGLPVNSSKKKVFRLSDLVTFGKHEGDTYGFILEHDKGYLRWLLQNASWLVLIDDDGNQITTI